ncbi:DUF1622 domain-containing protein [Microbulbifer flavimaris]|uniref:DUF1622 domain-containing protein n=2 Tax=Microbulbiferaceae TaxID=1706373 RepID=A0ABX4HY35_9GAMM|nr:hypothetical protein AVO43_12595 [Microbulbifer sp. ZGT114]PCO04903.1 DUF1622 domain-containing protein [Microbulbifer flavimaris]
METELQSLIQSTNALVELAGFAIEVFGVLVMIVATVHSTIHFLKIRATVSHEESYTRYRQNLGRGIILGLEFLIAGDIVRTVIVAQTLENVGILAVIVFIRTFLGITLHLEVEGRWPWQSRSQPPVK